MTFDAPAQSFSAAVANPTPPRRIAWTADLGGICEVDREIRDVTSKMVRRFEDLGCVVEEVSPDFGPVDEVFMVLRSQQFVVDREMQIAEHRDKIKPDIIWNTELGLKQSPSRLAWAERERAALFRRMREIKAFASGLLEFRITVEGRAPDTNEISHTAFAHRAVNPLDKLMLIHRALQALDARRAAAVRHPALQKAIGRSTNLLVSHMRLFSQSFTSLSCA